MIEAEPVYETLATRAAGLFRAFRGGEQDQMGELVALLTPILWHTARAQHLDRESAEDVVQTSWLTLVRSADSITDPQAVLQWLIVTTKREAWRVAKRAGRTDPVDFSGAETDLRITLPTAPPAEMPETAVARADEQRRLWRHIAQLPERCRALLRVVAFADRPDYAAVATALGMPVGSIGPTRGRCLAKLRLLLVNDPSWEG